MPSTINASTTSGLVSSADLSGTLELQSNGVTKATVSSTGLALDTLTTTGNVGIGTSSPAQRLHVANSGGTYIEVQNTADSKIGYFGVDTEGQVMQSGGAYPIKFLPQGVEAARFDAFGNLLVGKNVAVNGSRLLVRSSATGSTFNTFWENSAGTNLGYIRDDGVFNVGVGALSPYNLTTAAPANVVVGNDGTLYRSTSSLKYKTDVQDAKHGLSSVMQLRSVTYKGNNDGEMVFGGLIAEEVHEVGLTEFVQYAEDGTPDALAYGNMVSLCIKAIQEQQAIITDLKARIETLEAK